MNILYFDISLLKQANDERRGPCKMSYKNPLHVLGKQVMFHSRNQDYETFCLIEKWGLLVHKSVGDRRKS